MAARKQGPSAGGDRRRTFAAFPPAAGSRSPFTRTWWGRAWVEALEATSMDSARLSRGRTYARRGDVEDITVTPGKATAKVQGSRPRPYSSSVTVRQLADEEWNRFLDVVASRAAHIAALLDKDMPPELLDDAKAAGVRLLPGRGDLTPDCSCPDWGWPCKHASALCYQIAALLDLDPFVLLLLRGRGETELMEELRTRNAAAAAAQARGTGLEESGVSRVSATGVSALDVFAVASASGGRLGLLEAITGFELPVLPAESGPPPVLAAASADGVDPVALERLVADAARRAHAQHGAYIRADSADAVPLMPHLTAWQDAVRLAADEDESESEEVYERVLSAYDLDDARMTMAILAWRQGGPAGLAVLETPWTPTPADKARARQSLEDWADDDGGDPPALRIWRNRWTAEAEGVQARLGVDGRWYPYRLDRGSGSWWPHEGAEREIAAALAGAARS